MGKLTDKQERFCQEYLIDLNATQAAIRAGYSEKTARQIGEQNLSKLDIQARLKELQEARQERTQVTQDYVLKTIVDTVERCKQAEPVMIKEDGVWVESGEYKFDSQAVLKGAELLGKHLAMWTDKTKIEGDLNVNTTLNEKVSPERARELLEQFSKGNFTDG
ncbi:terminase small subunit [Sphingobacterium kyonggiense]